VGDGTTTVVILAGEFLSQAKPFIEEGVHARVSRGRAGPACAARRRWLRRRPPLPPRTAPRPAAPATHPAHPPSPPRPPLPLQSIIKSYRAACQLAVVKIKELAISLEGKSDAEKRDLLVKCASTSLNSKLVRVQRNSPAARVAAAGRPRLPPPPPPPPLHLVPTVAREAGGTPADAQASAPPRAAARRRCLVRRTSSPRWWSRR
jgi:T-complex protein 1 subunit eta